MLNRYEVTKVVGMRALHLSHGAAPNVQVEDDLLRRDTFYVAALELRLGRLDAIIQRSDGTLVPVKGAQVPPNLDVFLDTKDGGRRSYLSVTALDTTLTTSS